MININRTTKRTAKDTRNDLEEVLDEEVFKKTIAWLEDEFMAKARELAQPSQPATAHVAKQETAKPLDTPKLTPLKPATVQPPVSAPLEQPIAGQPSEAPERQPAPNTHQQQPHLSKRPPEKKPAVDEEKKSIFDRIKVNREPRQDNGGKPKQPQQKFDRNQQSQPHAHKRPQDASNSGEAEDLKKQIKETPEEEAQRQARLDELLSKSKKVHPRDSRERSACTSPTAGTKSASSCTPKRTVRGSRSATSAKAASTCTPRYCSLTQIPCKFGYHCQRENCSYKHPLNFKFAGMQAYHQTDSFHKPAHSNFKNKRPSPQNNFNSTTQAAGGD